MKSINLKLSEELVAAIDQEAAYNGTTRTGMIRRMLMAYLRPETAVRLVEEPTGVTHDRHEDLYADPEELYKTVQRQRALASLREWSRQVRRDQRLARLDRKKRTM